MLKALISTRFSDAKQIGGTSTEMQLKSCRDYCKQSEIKIVGVDSVEAESAKESNTKRIARMLEFCQKYKGQIDSLIVYKLDRFSRDTAQFYYLKTELLKLGITLRSATEPINDTPVGKLTETMLIGIATFENDVKRERVKLSFRTLLEKGICPWSKSVGYKPNKNALGRVGIPITDNEHGLDDGIKEVFSKFLNGYTQADLAKYMTDKQLINYKNKTITFSKQLINNILRNKFYMGVIEVKKWQEEFPGAHVPLIKSKTFNDAQNKLTGSKSKHLTINPDFPLKDRLYCEICDCKMTACWSTNRVKTKYPFYFCRSNQHPAQRSINRQTFEENFYNFLCQVKPKKEYLSRFTSRVIKAYQNRQQDFETKSVRIRKKLDGLESEKAGLIKLMSQGHIDVEDGSENLKELKSKITQLKLELNETHDEEFKLEYLITFAEKFFQTLPQIWLTATDVNLKIRIQRLLFPQGIRYSYPGFSNTSLSPIFNLIEVHGTPKSTRVSPSINLSNQEVYLFLRTIKQWEQSFGPEYQFLQRGGDEFV